MALPPGMMRHAKTGMLWARKDIPKPLQQVLGQTSFKKSLRTKDVTEARPIFHSVMRDFEVRIDAARKSLAGTHDHWFRPVTVELNLPDEVARTWALAESLKPHNQMKAAVDNLGHQLQQSGLIPKAPPALSVDELFKKWKKERKPSFESASEYERAKTQFTTLIGDLPIADYTAMHARRWKEHVLDMRDKKGQEMAFATYAKIFGMVRTLFKYADRNELLISDPFLKVTLEKPKRPQKSERQDWDESELQTWFNSPIYVERKRPRGGDGEAAYWLPVLALFHGFRAGELCQLDRADVVLRDKVYCLSMAPSDDNEEVPEKSIKTDKSIRVVPLHKRVIELGFLKYAATVKSKKLFPMLKPDARGRWSGSFSKWFGYYRKSLGLTDRYKDFHSLRHTWKTHARGAEIPEEVHDEISGHESRSVGRTYGKFPISTLKTYVDKVHFNIEIPTWTSSSIG